MFFNFFCSCSGSKSAMLKTSSLASSTPKPSLGTEKRNKFNRSRYTHSPITLTPRIHSLPDYTRSQFTLTHRLHSLPDYTHSLITLTSHLHSLNEYCHNKAFKWSVKYIGQSRYVWLLSRTKYWLEWNHLNSRLLEVRYSDHRYSDA